MPSSFAWRDRGELRLEVLVARLVALVVHDRAAELLELREEVVGEPDGVGVPDVAEDRDLLHALLRRELRHHRPLERVDEADAEDVGAGLVAVLRDLRVRRGRGDVRHLVRVGDRRHRERAARGDLAEQHRHLVLGDEPGGGDGRLLGLALVVVSLEVELLPLHAALRVQLLDREADALVGRVAEGRLLPGHRADVAEPERAARRGGLGRRRRGRGGLLLFTGGEGEEQGCGRNECAAHGGSSRCGDGGSCSTV